MILKTTGADGVIRWDATSVVIASDYKPSSTGALVVNRTGGYTFYVVANNPTKILLDGQLLVESPEAKPQVGGTTGNMAQLAVKSIGLMTGPHAIEVMRTRGAGDDNFAWYWEGPNQPLTLIDRAVPKASSSQKIR